MPNRYLRQLTLPEMTPEKQEALAQTTILMVGAGGLGSAALPYLAGAGIGHIYIADHDRINISNLHRQIIYRADQAGQNKATCAGNFLRALNPDIQIHAINESMDKKSATTFFSGHNVDLILDGSDNFETKALLNELSIEKQIPLISASITLFEGQIGSFEGYKQDRPCYRCLFPEIPANTQNCSDTGILGTSAAIIGTLQAHITLCRLLNIEIAHNREQPFARINLKTLKIEHYSVPKDPKCPHCCTFEQDGEKKRDTTKDTEKPDNILPEIQMINIHQIEDETSVIIDVRHPIETETEPVKHPLLKQHPRNIPLPELSTHLNDLPKDKRIILLCPKNNRSKYAARYLLSEGYDNVCILDRFSF